MLNPFFGEFLLHPAPLEISGNTCSHNCCYCFSNIRRSCRTAKTQTFINQINKGSKSYSGALLSDGYAICLSNRTDPFSDSNKNETDTILKYLLKIPNGIFIQTKGGKTFYDNFELIKQSGKKNIIFYYTITSRDNDILKITEPGAPSYDEKLKQIKTLIENDFLVIAAFNPVVKEWHNEVDLQKTFDELIQIGVNHFIMQKLHMTTADVKIFTNNRADRFINPEILERACKKSDRTDQYYLQNFLVKNKDKANILAFGMPFKTDFFTDVRNKLGKCFPSMYDFINYCHEKGKGIYTFDDFINSLNIKDQRIFNLEFNGLSSYILRVARNVWKGNGQAQNVKTLYDVLKIYWNDKRIKGSPQNNFLFRRIEKDGDCQVYFDYDIHKEKRMVTVPEIK